MKVSVIGGGSMATAIVKMLQDANQTNEIMWYMRNSAQCEEIEVGRRNPKYLTSVKIDKSIQVSTDLPKTIDYAEIIILAIPSSYLENVLENAILHDLKGKIVISTTKGILPRSRMVASKYIHLRFDPYYSCSLMGPCHAEEIANEKLTYLTIEGQQDLLNKTLACFFETDYTNIQSMVWRTEIAEYAAAAKNIFAIMSGIAHGIGYGDNFQAVLVSNAMKEIISLLGGKGQFEHSSVWGDLLVTCYSPHSRNRRLGNLLGRGYGLQTALEEMEMVAEGYYATEMFIEEIQTKEHNDFPIINTAHNILYGRMDPRIEFKKLEKKLT